MIILRVLIFWTILTILELSDIQTNHQDADDELAKYIKMHHEEKVKKIQASLYLISW